MVSGASVRACPQPTFSKIRSVRRCHRDVGRNLDESLVDVGAVHRAGLHELGTTLLGELLALLLGDRAPVLHADDGDGGDRAVVVWCWRG